MGEMERKVRRAKRKKDLADPFEFLAKGIATEQSDLWEEEPVSVRDFIEKKEFLNLKWDGKRGCRPKILDIAEKISQSHIREAMLLLGKGCLSGLTHITTNSGIRTMKYMCESQMPFVVQSYDKDYHTVWNIGVCMFRGIQRTCRYTFSNGKHLDATENHNIEVFERGIIKISDMKIGDMMLAAKNAMLQKETIVKNNTHWVRLVSIKDRCDEPTYDILCDNPNHNYCANGLHPMNSGKDFISSILHLYGIYRCLCMTSPQIYHGLSPSSMIYFVNTARNDMQARNVFFAEFRGMLESCPWFAGKFDEPGANTIKFAKNITALSANSQAFGWLGYNTIQWVGDELAFFLEKDADEESESRAEECWESALGSCMTRFRHYFKIIGITTPRFDDDFVMRKYAELTGREDAFTMQAATWEMNPNLTIDDFKHALERNFRRTMRDYGARPMGVIESFWADPDFIDNNVCEACKECPIYLKREISTDIYECYDYEGCVANPYKGNGEWREWLVADPGLDYYMHFDLSKNKDKVGFTLGSIIDYIQVELDTFELIDQVKPSDRKRGDQKQSMKEIDAEDKYALRPIIQANAVGFIDPASKRDPRMLRNGEIHYEAILKNIVRYLLDRGFNIVRVTLDQFQAHSFKQTIEDFGIDIELISLDRNDEVPAQAKNTLTENRVVYPYCRIMSREAKHLKYINGKKIDHAKGECFIGETKFSLITGEEISFEESVELFGYETYFRVYSYNPESKEVVIGTARNQRLEVGSSETYIITISNGQSIECSHDHKFMRSNGFYTKASQLTPNDRLMTLHTDFNPPMPEDHFVVSVIKSGLVKKMFCIQVDRFNNFALTSGVFVHNSKDVWDSFAATIYNCEMNDGGQGSFEVIED